ncbi:hypothetical protein IWW50_002240 [Coemansia erecta]|nr:hypothetical protein GGF43_000242 [Coemansia sp. RSA 2618]KAJ2826706.1 hypothetical protein IWW50_002240 [Coemansia erecta]
MLSREKDIYNNCRVLDIDGNLLFRAGNKRLEWYLSRNLAARIDDRTIQLSFANKGSGRQDEPFYLQEMQNICTVCGTPESLTMHHIVPHHYRKYMDESIKSRSSHDLLPLCTRCHDEYERHAVRFKKHLAACFCAPMDGHGWIERRDIGKGGRAAATLMSRSLDKIPSERIDHLRAVVCEVVGQNRDLFSDDVRALIPCVQGDCNGECGGKRVLEELVAMDVRVRGPGFRTHGEIVVNAVAAHNTSGSMCGQCKRIASAGVPGLVAAWRRHFVEHADPAYLPNHWSIEYPCVQN